MSVQLLCAPENSWKFYKTHSAIPVASQQNRRNHFTERQFPTRLDVKVRSKKLGLIFILQSIIYQKEKRRKGKHTILCIYINMFLDLLWGMSSINQYIMPIDEANSAKSVDLQQSLFLIICAHPNVMTTCNGISDYEMKMFPDKCDYF